tara:strand:+ start:495 stop:902 length:408 start_codon:yes stop_codon:yes gene_type:complete
MSPSVYFEKLDTNIKRIDENNSKISELKTFLSDKDNSFTFSSPFQFIQYSSEIDMARKDIIRRVAENNDIELENSEKIPKCICRYISKCVDEYHQKKLDSKVKSVTNNLFSGNSLNVIIYSCALVFIGYKLSRVI